MKEHIKDWLPPEEGSERWLQEKIRIEQARYDAQYVWADPEHRHVYDVSVKGAMYRLGYEHPEFVVRRNLEEAPVMPDTERKEAVA